MKPEDLHWLDSEEAEEETHEAEAEQPEASEEPEGRRFSPALRILLATLTLVAIAAVIFYVSGAYKSILGEPRPKTLAVDRDPVVFSSNSMNRVYPFGELALHLSSDGLQVFDVKGTLLWDEPLSMASPQLLVAGNYISIADLGGSQLLLFDQEGLINTITTEAPIQYSALSPSGASAVILDTSDSHTILVYDKAGALMVRRVTYPEENGLPMDIAINDDATCIATAYAIFTETQLKSAVTLFNLTDTASDSIDRIAGNYIYENTLVSDLKYMGSNLICVGDNKLIGLDASGNTSELWTKALDYQISAVAFGDSFFSILLGDGLIGVAGEPDADFLMIAADGRTIAQEKLTGNGQILAAGNILVYLNGFDYTALNAEGRVLWTYSAENAMQLYPLNKDFALGSLGNSMQVYRVTEANEEDG